MMLTIGCGGEDGLPSPLSPSPVNAGSAGGSAAGNPPGEVGSEVDSLGLGEVEFADGRHPADLTSKGGIRVNSVSDGGSLEPHGQRNADPPVSPQTLCGQLEKLALAQNSNPSALLARTDGEEGIINNTYTAPASGFNGRLYFGWELDTVEQTYGHAYVHCIENSSITSYSVESTPNAGSGTRTTDLQVRANGITGAPDPDVKITLRQEGYSCPTSLDFRSANWGRKGVYLRPVPYPSNVTPVVGNARSNIWVRPNGTGKVRMILDSDECTTPIT